MPTLSLPTTWDYQQLTAQDDLDRAIALVAAHYNFAHHPYLLWMQADPTQRSQFLNSQLGFRGAVEAFSQAIAAVLARVPRVEDRLALAENLAEEHGHGQSVRTHKQTFHQYLIALGATAEDLQMPCPIGVVAFNQAIINYCLVHPAPQGAAMLGMIEYLYIGISSTIAKTVHVRGWTEPGSQSHYAVHEVLDVAHARQLFELSQEAWSNPRSRPEIAQAMGMAAHYFWTLYQDLPHGN